MKERKQINLGGGITLTIEVDVPQVTNTQTRSRVVEPKAASNPFAMPMPNREPDGFDAHIDRPLRENYRGNWFASQRAFETDLKKYRDAERAVKACNWPTKEPMGNGVPQWPVPQPMAPHSGVLVEGNSFESPRNARPSVVKREAWTKPTTRRNTMRNDVRFSNGIVPLGAVVVDFMPDGEPIFRI